MRGAGSGALIAWYKVVDIFQYHEGALVGFQWQKVILAPDSRMALETWDAIPGRTKFVGGTIIPLLKFSVSEQTAARTASRK